MIIASPAAAIRNLQPVSSGKDTRREDCNVSICKHGYGLFQTINNHRRWDSAAKTTAKNVHFNRCWVPGIVSERHFIDYWNILVIISR
jgi:hypothetical protein